MNDFITQAFEDSIQAKKTFLKDNLDNLITVIDRIAQALAKGNKLLLFGNGGERRRCPTHRG